MATKYKWVPGTSLGPYVFGQPIKPYLDDGLLEHRAISGEFGGGDSYDDVAEEITIFPDEDDEGNTVTSGGADESGRIESIQCYRSLLYNDEELIGISVERAAEILERPPVRDGEEVFMFSGEVQTTADFDDLGLTLWFQDGISVSANVAEIVEQ